MWLREKSGCVLVGKLVIRSQLPPNTCQSILGHDTERHIPSNRSVNVCDIKTLHKLFLRGVVLGIIYGEFVVDCDLHC